MSFSGYDYNIPSFFQVSGYFSITLLLFHVLLLAVVQTLLVWIWLSKLLTKITPKNLYYFYFQIRMVIFDLWSKERTLFQFFVVHRHIYLNLYTWSSLRGFAVALPVSGWAVTWLRQGNPEQDPPLSSVPAAFPFDGGQLWVLSKVIWLIRVELLVFCRE